MNKLILLVILVFILGHLTSSIDLVSLQGEQCYFAVGIEYRDYTQKAYYYDGVKM